MMYMLRTLCVVLFFFPTLQAASQTKDTIPGSDTIRQEQLQNVVVESRYYRKYNPSSMSDALRSQLSLLEMPQNIQIISVDALRDQMAFELNESVTRNVSGTMREELHNMISPDIYARGGYINPQRNGVDLRPLLKGPIGDDVSIIEGIEFVKGPSGFMTSMSDPAGSYNIITKKPNGIQRNTFKMSYGSFNLFRAEADMSGTLDEKKRLQYRFNLMGMSSKGFIQFDRKDRILIAPSLKYNFKDQSSLTLEYIYQRLNNLLLSEAQISPYGYGTTPIDFAISDPTTQPYRANDHQVFLTYEKPINDNWKFTTKLANIHDQYQGNIFWVYGVNESNPDTLNRYYVYDGATYNIFSSQAYLQGRFVTGTIKHAILGGIDFNHKKTNTVDTWNTASAIYPLSISNPRYANTINNDGMGGNFDSENIIDGVDNLTNSTLYYVSAHVMDEISLLKDKLKLNVGLRYTQSDAQFNQYGDNTSAQDKVLTPRAGITYMLLPVLSVYALYDKSFLPQAGIAFDGSPLQPLTGTSYEAGIKKDWNDGAWNTTVSVYRLFRNRILVNDPGSNSIYQTGESRSQGIEFDVKGRIFKRLNAIVNYAYTDSKITKDDKNPEMVGTATPNRVRHIQNTWLNYMIPMKQNSNFSISAGYQYLAGRAERFTTATPTPLNDIFRLDGGISWTRKKYSLQLMVNNLLNQHIYSTAWNRNGLYYWVQAAPRNFRCALTFNL